MGAMEMAGDRALGAAQSVNCEFCGTPVLTGAKLCKACRSALKRARNEPTSVLSPLVKRATDSIERRKARKSAKARDGDKSAIVIPPPVGRRRSATPALVGTLLAAVCITGYAILQVSEHAPPPEHAMQNPDATQGVPLPATAPAVPAALAPIVLPPEAEPEPAPHLAPRAHGAARRLVVAPDSVPVPIAAPAPIIQQAPPPELPKVQSPPDRRAQLRSAFAQCTSTDVLAKAFCEQRARIDLCDGLWGSVPQCPAQRDYGG
jgi:hypothetical protein